MSRLDGECPSVARVPQRPTPFKILPQFGEAALGYGLQAAGGGRSSIWPITIAMCDSLAAPAGP